MANSLLQKILYHRSPVVLSKADEHRWLDLNLELSEVTEMLCLYSGLLMNAEPISPDIKHAGNQEKENLLPIGQRLVEESEYFLEQHLELEGMGTTSAHKRRINQEYAIQGKLGL